MTIVLLQCCCILSCGRDSSPEAARIEAKVAAPAAATEVRLHATQAGKSSVLRVEEKTISLWDYCQQDTQAISVRGSANRFAHSSCSRRDDHRFEILRLASGEVVATLSRNSNQLEPPISTVSGVTDVYREGSSEPASPPPQNLIIAAGEREWLIPASRFEAAQAGTALRSGKRPRQAKAAEILLATLLQEQSVAWDSIEEIVVHDALKAHTLKTKTEPDLATTLFMKRNRKGQFKVWTHGAGHSIEIRRVQRIELRFLRGEARPRR